MSTSEHEPRRRHRIWVEVPGDIAQKLQAARREDGVSPARRLRALAALWAADEQLQERVLAELLDEQTRRATAAE